MIRIPPRGPSSLVLLGLMLCTSGCLFESAENPMSASTDTGGSGTPQIMLVPESLYILQATDIYSTSWPQAFQNYRFIVCNPSITYMDVARIHHDLPGVTALAYINIQDLLFDQYPNSPYWQVFAAVFDTSWCVRDLPTNRVIRVQGYTGVPGSGLMHAIPHLRNMETLVRFYRDATMAAGWDGLDIDQSHQDYPWWRKPIVQEQSSNFDVDGDGVTDTIDDLAQKYVAGRAILTMRLRQELGNSAYLVANSGGPLADPNLNGITIENVGVKWTVTQATGFLQAQKAVGRTPFIAAGWVISASNVTPTRTLARTVPGCCYGRDPGHYH